jgi:hypothetical protein
MKEIFTKAKFKRVSFFIIFSFAVSGILQAQQIDIPRINTMPDFPQPYEMRDWKQVASGYDSLVFDITLTGQFQPFVFFRDQSVNYPEYASFGLHTAVGTNFPASGEGINVIPAVVGATLVGIDKSDQFNENWAMMIQEYFNKRPAENIYLNHPVTNSGFDWWYETMPNIFFMQLKYLYPEIAVFQDQLPVLAMQWLRAVRAMGGSDTPWNVPYMNYRAWNMSEMQPLDQGVKQPEAAGALAWILYNAYISTGNPEFLKGAEWSMEFLDAWESNPSYELQLPYGIYTAARMNAEIGTNYDIEKMVNWAFDRGHLRGWGAISGNWGGYDCHGLIGEANDNGNDYAFMMNGFQQAAALVPMVRYDHRFAKAIAKWVLNMANASRLFYPAYLPSNMQDNAAWAQTYDPESYIAYEALREIKFGHSPYATGDAIDGGWAQTNLMLYGSSHVGYLAAILETTNIEGILQLDLLKTDFYNQDALPTYLYYNPFQTTEEIILDLPAGTYKIYDVISKNLILENQSGTASLSVGPGSVIMPVVVPQNAVISVQGNKTFADDVIIDFNNGQDTGLLPPRIKALAAVDTMVVTGGSTEIYCTATDPQNSNLTYYWFFPDDSFTGQDQVVFNAPDETGFYNIGSKVVNEAGLSDSLGIVIQVVEKIPYPPQIIDIIAEPRKAKPGETIQLHCIAEDFYNEPLTFNWLAGAGSISGEGSQVIFTAPAETGDYFISCEVTNPDGLSVKDSISVMIRQFPDEGVGNLIARYTLRGNTNDNSGNALHGTAGGGLSWTTDQNGFSNWAAYFNGSSAFVLLPASELFNFTEAMSISLFVKTDEHTVHEQHPVSHGSWEHRYKISLSNQRFRFTLNTGDGIRDLDTETLINAGQWYHLVAVYDGQDMEIWLDGKLDAFHNHTGNIGISPVNPVLGQNIPGNNNYNFKGAMNLVHFYDFALSPLQIMENYVLDASEITEKQDEKILVYPNPVTNNRIFLRTGLGESQKLHWEIIDLYGKSILSGNFTNVPGNDFSIQLGRDFPAGFYILKVVSGKKVYTTNIMVL